MSRKETAPTRLADVGDYRAAAEKLTKLQHEIQHLESEQGRLSAALQSNSQVTSSLEREAFQLLNDQRDNAATEAESRELLKRISHEIAVRKKAIELQRRELDRERSLASRQVVKARLPEYLGIVKRLAAALAELKSALAAEQEFREQLQQDDVSFLSEIRPMGFMPNHVTAEAIDEWKKEANEYYPGVA